MPEQNKKSNAETVYDSLRGLILNGQLRAGENLRPAILKERYGFGLTPIREALTRLQIEKLVESVFNQGFRVAPISHEELSDLARARRLVEIEMLRDAITLGDEEWEGGIVAAHYQFTKVPVPKHDTTADEFTRWEARHDAFHAALLAPCSSPWLRQLSETLNAQHKRYHRNIFLDVATLSATHKSLAQQIDKKLSQVLGLPVHTELMDAVLTRQTQLACDLLSQHLDLSAQAYENFQKLVIEQRAA